MEKLAGKAGFSLTPEIEVLRVEITITKGKSVFKLHAILDIKTNSKNQPKPNKKQESVLPRSKRNLEMKYPFRILALKENENLID